MIDASRSDPASRCGTTVFTRMDTHCHSLASSGPAVKALGLIGCPECYSPPEKVYEQARQRGMDLFTLTDHDTISGALSLVERGFEGVIIGEEVTVYFPEDHCKLHVLVWGLSPELHEEIATLGLRNDVYLFASWLHDRNLPHALAHPLYIQNRKFTKWHLDRCSLLFKGFETLNGAHSGTHARALDAYLTSLTPGRVHRMIEELAREPLWPRIWEKARTGGSDDHGLLNVGRTFTQVSSLTALDARITLRYGKVVDPRDFFRLVMNGKASEGGAAGHSSLLAHQLAAVGAHYTANRLLGNASPTARAVASKFMRFAGVRVSAPSRFRLAASRLRSIITRSRRPLAPLLTALTQSIRPVLDRYPDLAGKMDPASWPCGAPLSDHDRMAGFADDLHAAIHQVLGDSAVRALRSKDRRGIVDHLLSYLALELSQLPYLFSLFHQNKERAFVEQLEHDAAQGSTDTPTAAGGPLGRPMKVMLFTDTLGDVNGVSRFIRNAAAQATETGRSLTVVTSTNFKIPDQPNLINFAPLFATKMPKYETLELVLPPLTKMLRFVDAQQPDVIHVSTPGSVGLVGLIAARMLRIPVIGVYHTDFPAYVDHLFQDEALTHICRQVMKFFYAPFRAVFTRSDNYLPSLEAIGVPRERTLRLRPGIRTMEFSPRFKDRGLWLEHNARPETIRAIFVGRVSVEKNMPMLSKVWKRADEILKARRIDAELVIIGDGPYRATMEEELRGSRVRFMGFRYDEELARIYASTDFFLFPSITDTLGQVVMEAQSSGLPVIVTDKGGPKEVVQDGLTGHVVPDEDLDQWVERIIQLVVDEPLRRQMSARAHEFMQPFSMADSFEHYWSVHERIWKDHLALRGIRPPTSPISTPISSPAPLQDAPIAAA